MSWAHVAAKNSHKPEDQEKQQSTAGNKWVDVDSGRTVAQDEKRQRQMALLDQALKSPEDAVSGMLCLNVPKVGVG